MAIGELSADVGPFTLHRLPGAQFKRHRLSLAQLLLAARHPVPLGNPQRNINKLYFICLFSLAKPPDGARGRPPTRVS